MIGFLFVGLVVGIVLSQVTVLAFWTALGHWPVMWRAIGAIAGGSLLALALCVAIGEMEAEWFVLAWILLLVATAAFLVLRWFRYDLVHVEQAFVQRSAELQFSLRQLMALITVTAILAAAGRILAPRTATTSTLLYGLAVASSCGGLALASVWAAFGVTNLARRLSLLMALTIPVAAFVYYVLETTDIDPGAAWATALIAYVLGTTGTLLGVRSMGFRLIRTSG